MNSQGSWWVHFATGPILFSRHLLLLHSDSFHLEQMPLLTAQRRQSPVLHAHQLSPKNVFTFTSTVFLPNGPCLFRCLSWCSAGVFPPCPSGSFPHTCSQLTHPVWGGHTVLFFLDIPFPFPFPLETCKTAFNSLSPDFLSVCNLATSTSTLVKHYSCRRHQCPLT